MHIEAELDELHTERLLKLQQRLNKTIPDIIAAAIDHLASTKQNSLETTDASPLYQALDAIGFIGCIETDEQLSTTYKNYLDFSDKCGGA